MFQAFNFKDVLEASVRGAWQIGDVLPDGADVERIAAHPVNKLQELLPGSWTPSPTPYGTEISDTDLLTP